MPFKFSVGQAVEYIPVSTKDAGLYTIVRQMPREEGAIDLKYCIKSESEPYERNVLECHLSSDVRAASEYIPITSRPSQRSRRQIVGGPLRGLR